MTRYHVLLLFSALFLIFPARSINIGANANTPLSMELNVEASLPHPALSVPDQISNEAAQFINKSFVERTASCSGSVYWGAVMSRRGVQRVSECKHMPQLTIKGEYFPPRALSESERLNRVDPQPVEWKGTARAEFKTCRISITGFSYDGAWSSWMDSLYVSFDFQKAKGKWTVIGFSSDTFDKISEIDCPQVKEYLKRYPSEGTIGNQPDNPPSGSVDSPSTRYQTYSTLGGLVGVGVPNNWHEKGDSRSFWFAPEGAFGQYRNQLVYTHGVNCGVTDTQSRNLQQATQEFLKGMAQGHGNLRQQSGYQRTTISGRTGLSMTLNNVNEATGQPETITVVTTQLRNGQLFYMIAVAPNRDFNSFQSAFRNILRSVQLND